MVTSTWAILAIKTKNIYCCFMYKLRCYEWEEKEFQNHCFSLPSNTILSIH